MSELLVLRKAKTMSITAVFNENSDQGPITLQNFVNEDAVAILVQAPDGGHQSFAIFGKVLIENFDGDAQNASVELRYDFPHSHFGSVLIDITSVRIPSNSAQSVSLEAVLTLPDPSSTSLKARVFILCNTFNGRASLAQLIALAVDEIHASDGKS